MKVNPLLQLPPRPKTKVHRLGEAHVEKIERIFYDYLEEEIHQGVFISEYPLVAYAYAYAKSRAEQGYNELGQEDIVDPPVLLGFNIKPEEEKIDTDALQVAVAILHFSLEIIKIEEQEEEEEEYVRQEGLLEEIAEESRASYYDLNDLGLAYLGGDVGNRPDSQDMYRAAEELAYLRKEEGILKEEEYSESILEKALSLAHSIIPQSRVVRDIQDDELLEIIVLPPIKEESYGKEDLQGPNLINFEDYEETIGELDQPAISELNNFLLEVGKVIYKNKSIKEKVNRWHGTSLSIAKAAFPNIVSSDIFYAGVLAGSLFDLEEMQREREED